MKIKEINSEQDYQDALKVASRYFDDEPEKNTPDGDDFENLITLIETYESKTFPRAKKYVLTSQMQNQRGQLEGIHLIKR